MNREPRRRTHLMTLLATMASALPACQPASTPAAQSGCDPDNGGITLPAGFCAVVVVDSVGSARHIEIAENGDVLLALTNSRGPERSVAPSGPPDTIVSGLPAESNHRAKSLALGPDGSLFGVVHGRDQLSALWSELYTDQESAEKPAEEFVRIEEGDDFGWPYCYFDPDTDTKVLSPEYGGDGRVTGRCAGMNDPLMDFPAHWAPNDLEFYSENQFPEEYRGGAFIAFHGSWNRSPEPQGGYNVVFAPFQDGSPTGAWEIFADGFAGLEVSPRGAHHRPVGVAMGPDGSLYISDSRMGKVWKVVYTGS